MQTSPFSATPTESVRVLIVAETDADAHALGHGVQSVIRDADITLVPMSSVADLFTGQRITLPTVTAAGALTEASYTFDADTNIAYIDAAAAAGDVNAGERGDTYGVGVLIADAETRGARTIALNLDGVTTLDGATGILVALAANPITAEGHPVVKGTAGLADIADLDTAKLNVSAAGMRWVLLTGDDSTVDTSHPGLGNLIDVSGINPDQPGWGAGGAIPVGLAWISSIVYGNAENVQVVSIADAIGVKDHEGLIVTAGALTPAVVRSASTAVVGVAGSAEGARLDADVDKGLEHAGAQLASDYLRISSVQG